MPQLAVPECGRQELMSARPRRVRPVGRRGRRSSCRSWRRSVRRRSSSHTVGGTGRVGDLDVVEPRISVTHSCRPTRHASDLPPPRSRAALPERPWECGAQPRPHRAGRVASRPGRPDQTAQIVRTASAPVGRVGQVEPVRRAAPATALARLLVRNGGAKLDPPQFRAAMSSAIKSR